jgi:prepilin-type N-terminal cleavage/methylation domain-containing protein
MRSFAYKIQKQAGFNLIELAIGMIIISLMAGSGLVVLSTQIDQNRFNETQRMLDLAKEALLGFAAVNGRLPCPSAATGGGLEDPPGGGACNGASDADGYYGFLPAATLGIANGKGNCAPLLADPAGNLTDPWNGCIRYAVSRANGNAATTTNGISGLTPWTSFTPNLRVCEDSACTQVLSSSAIFVVYSTGKNNLQTVPATNVDEAQNVNNNRDFVRHEPRQTGQTGGAYDDVVDWLPLTLFVSRLIQAGQLP